MGLHLDVVVCVIIIIVVCGAAHSLWFYLCRLWCRPFVYDVATGVNSDDASIDFCDAGAVHFGKDKAFCRDLVCCLKRLVIPYVVSYVAIRIRRRIATFLETIFLPPTLF